MKRRKFLIYWTALQASVSLVTFLTLLLTQNAETAIIPPPWSDPERNPCASMPGGWQMIYWPPLKKCFKIFTLGFPCPETMELSPTATIGSTKRKSLKNNSNGPLAECRCPPGTVLSAQTNRCHKIFERGPCAKGQYLSPLMEVNSGPRRTTNRWGVCKTPHTCPGQMIFWPKDGKCYTKLTKGPCVKGKLLLLNEDGLGECKCENTGELRQYYYDQEDTCHEHFTKGPCSTPGHLFLPGGRCDCHRFLPHYHEDQQMCYELNTLGPCPPGHVFRVPENVSSSNDDILGAFVRAQCQCKDGYVPWSDGLCYRLYTRGPCAADEFLINATSCSSNFCGKNRLYFPEQQQCYRIGSQGPCDQNQVVVFDFTARPSIDGISYNGMCGCAGIIKNLDQQCATSENDVTANTCESAPGMVELDGGCYKLYTRGPCGPGQWLQPLKTQVNDARRSIISKAKCVCRPGYTPAEEGEAALLGSNLQRCNAPTVGLARYLNQQSRQRHNSKLPVSFNFPNFQF